MKLYDFDRMFMEAAQRHVHERMKTQKDLEAIEAELPALYIRWLNQPLEALGGASPAGYFAAYERPEELLALLREYGAQSIPAPDALLERIAQMEEQAVAPLIELAADEAAGEELRVTALNLLIELQAEEAIPLCLQLIRDRKEEDALADVAAELLQALGGGAVLRLLDTLEEATEAALPTYLDLLCNFPGDERIYKYTVRQFLRQPARRALYASYLGKLGDARAIEPLRRALRLSDLGYLDYLEIRNAIEALGGELEVGDERAFDGDPYYEALK